MLNWEWYKQQFAVAAFGLLIAGLIGIFKADFIESLTLYDPILVSFTSILFITLFVLEVRTESSRKKLYVHYLLLILGVVLSSIFLENTYIQNGSILYASICAWIFRYFILLPDALHKKVNSENSKVGFATTAVLVVKSHKKNKFLLILNRNLNDGEGLWVPPGGHFNPQQEDPSVKILSKINDEVGLKAKIVQHQCHLVDPIENLNTNETEWIYPPAFVLKENMLPRCSHGHFIHFDFVYICIADTAVNHLKQKYKEPETLFVEVEQCIRSFAETETAVKAEIKEWYKRYGGMPPSRISQLTDDVIWRLHLTAKIISEK